MNNRMGEYITDGCDLDGNLSPGVHRYPTFTCGHCSNVTVMRADRARPREYCGVCASYICERNELCHNQCTPLHSMAGDHFEGVGHHGRLVGAIMQGATSIAEAEKLGLIKEN